MHEQFCTHYIILSNIWHKYLSSFILSAIFTFSECRGPVTWRWIAFLPPWEIIKSPTYHSKHIFHPLNISWFKETGIQIDFQFLCINEKHILQISLSFFTVPKIINSGSIRKSIQLIESVYILWTICKSWQVCCLYVLVLYMIKNKFAEQIQLLIILNLD